MALQFTSVNLKYLKVIVLKSTKMMVILLFCRSCMKLVYLTLPLILLHPRNFQKSFYFSNISS